MGKRTRTFVYVVVVSLIAAGCGSSSEAAREPDTSPPAQSATAPARIVALTGGGKVVLIDLATMSRTATLAAFRLRTHAESSSIYGRADDLTALPGGEILVSTCCEPAGGAVLLLDDGEQSEEFSGWDPQVDAAGTSIAIAGSPGIVVHASSPTSPTFRTIVGDASVLDDPPEDPAWSPNGRELVFTAGGRLGVVEAHAASLAEALFLESDDGTYWAAPAFSADGIVAVRQTGTWGSGEPMGPSRLLSVDPATGEAVELASSSGPITDVTVDASGRHLLWVDDGRLRWRVDGVTSVFDGDFVAAAWYLEPA